MQNKEIINSIKRQDAHRKKLWKAAIKWPLYSVAIMPVLLAAGWNISIGSMVRWDQLIGFLLASILLLIWENLTNDLFDSETGVDEFKFHSVVTLLGERKIVKNLAYISLSLGLLLIFLLASRSHPAVFLIVLGSCSLGYLYQGPPFRLGYNGLGEPLCWLAFGPLGTTAAILVISVTSELNQEIPWSTAMLIGSGPALATTLVLFCSHFHQVVQDAFHGKKTPLVRLGTLRASNLVPWIITLILLLEWGPVIRRDLPISALFGAIGIPSAISLIRLLKKHHNQPELISECKFLALRFQTLNGLGLSIGLAIAPGLGIHTPY